MSALAAWMAMYAVNSVWQVPVVFAGAWLAARSVRRLGVMAEHRIWCGALWLAVALPAMSAAGSGRWWRGAAASLSSMLSSMLAAMHGGAAAGDGRVTVRVGEAVAAGGGVQLSPAAARWLLGVYALLLLVAGARLAWGVWQVRQLRLRAVPLAEDAPLRASWESMWQRRRVDVGRVVLAASERVAGPVTIGVQRRWVILPLAWLEDVDAEDLRAALAHEGAHVARGDYGRNLLYQLLSLPVAYHPALWLLQSRIVETREMLCDAMAAEGMSGRSMYAHALLRLASRQLKPAGSAHVYAIGIFDANQFERRVMQLTTKSMQVQTAGRVARLAACGLLAAGTCASAMMLHVRMAAPGGAALPVAGSATPQADSAMPQAGAALPLAGSSLPSAGDKAISIGSGVMAGQIVSRVNPVYPQAAKDAKVSGTVRLHAVISKEGDISALTVISGPSELQASALDAVRQWRYKPYLLNGEPVEVETTITVNYSLAK